MTTTRELEIIDNPLGIVIRRVIVGPLATNCWILTTNDRTAIVIDPGDEPQRIIDAAADAQVRAVVLTHSHFDHVLGLPDVADAWGCPVLMHPDDAPVWPHELDHLHTHGHFDAGNATADLIACGCTLAPPQDSPSWRGTTLPIRHGQQVELTASRLTTLHTPGHTPGGISLQIGAHVFTGDTLFPGGPGLTGRPLSDFATIIGSIRTQLFALPDRTHVHPGHGPSTTIGDERPQLTNWIKRGW